MILIPTLIFVTFVSWVYAAYNAVKLASHRRPEVPMSNLIMSGVAWFKADNFTEAGRPYQKALLTSFVAFFICIAVLMVLVMLQAPSLTPQYDFKPQ